jgi:hypothetical protein
VEREWLKARTLQIEVVDIKGQCPVYKVADAFRIMDGYRLVAEMPMYPELTEAQQVLVADAMREFCSR